MCRWGKQLGKNKKEQSQEHLGNVNNWATTAVIRQEQEGAVGCRIRRKWACRGCSTPAHQLTSTVPIFIIEGITIVIRFVFVIILNVMCMEGIATMLIKVFLVMF